MMSNMTHLKGYEISENELNISLEQFRMEHTDANGQPK